MRIMVLMLCLVANSYAIVAEILSDSPITVSYQILDLANQAKGLYRMEEEIKALTSQSSWSIDTNQEGLQKLSDAMSKIDKLSYGGINLDKKLADVFPAFKSVYGSTYDEITADYQKIAQTNLQSVSSVLTGLSDVNKSNMDITKATHGILSLGTSGLSQAQISMAGAQIATQQFNAIQNLQQISAMQTQLVAQNLATQSQKDADAQKLNDEMKKMRGFRIKE